MRRKQGKASAAVASDRTAAQVPASNASKTSIAGAGCALPVERLHGMSRIEDSSAEVHNAREKLRECPEFGRFVWSWCLNEVAHDRRFSMRAALEEARRIDWTRTDGDPFRVNNNLSPALARLFVAEHPEAAPYIETRRAACDGML